MPTLITGATGFLGSHLAAALRARGEDVLSFGRDGNRDAIRAARIRVVHHLAFDLEALARGEVEDRRVNVDGAARLIEAAIDAGARQVVFASSGLVYGETEELPIGEAHPLRPESPNGISKLRAEETLGALCAKRGVTLAVLRHANFYGGGPRDRSVLAKMIVALREGRPAQIGGDGSQTRDFIHMGDVVAAHLAVAARELGGAWNVGTGIETSILDAWEIVQQAIGRRGTIEWLPARLGDRARNALDGRRLRALAGLPEPRGLREGVGEMAGE